MGSSLVGPLICQADLQQCRAFIRRHSKSFYFSSLLLPRPWRHQSWALYAFCRKADDSVDGDNGGDGRISSAPAEAAVLLQRLESLQKRLEQLYDGQLADGTTDAIDRAFYAVVQNTGLPRAIPEHLLLGMKMDACDVRYTSWDELLTYCFHVAATVGLMMTFVMGHRMPVERRAEVYLRACDLGVAMQLTNIARDIGEDGLRGRVYLPDELLHRFGLHRDAVLEICAKLPTAPLPLRRAVAEVLERAALHYRAARQGIAMLPKAAWLGIGAAESIYRGIGERLAAAQYDPLRRRARISLAGKLWRLLHVFGVGLFSPHRRLPARHTSGPADALLRRYCQEVGILE